MNTLTTLTQLFSVIVLATLAFYPKNKTETNWQAIVSNLLSEWGLPLSWRNNQHSKEQETNVVSEADRVFIQKLQEVVLMQLDNPSLNRDTLADAVNLSVSQTYRKLKSITGQTPSVFIRTIRLQQSLKLIKSELLSISEIAYAVGFNDPNYFSRVFKAEFGMPPLVFYKREKSGSVKH